MKIIIKSFDIGQGEFFLIKIMDTTRRRYFNLMVDCGEKGHLEDLKNILGEQRLNGIVVTHVDDDHITGVIDLVENCKYSFLDNVFIIFNKYDETLITYEKGNKLYEIIKQKLFDKLLIKSYARNYNRENRAIGRLKKREELPVLILSKLQRQLVKASMLKKDIVYITLLTPDIQTLKKFMKNWKKVSQNIIKNESGNLKNQSSITFLLEFNNKRILMMGDGMVNEVLKVLDGFNDIETIDYVKLSHHGAQYSNSGIEEFKNKYNCKKFGVTIKENQNTETKHPSRDIINILANNGCHIYTSTNFRCDNDKDSIHNIEKQAEIEI